MINKYYVILVITTFIFLVLTRTITTSSCMQWWCNVYKCTKIQFENVKTSNDLTVLQQCFDDIKYFKQLVDSWYYNSFWSASQCGIRFIQIKINMDHINLWCIPINPIKNNIKNIENTIKIKLFCNWIN